MRVLVLVGIGLHVPNHLMGEELGLLRSLKSVTFDIAQSIIPKSLDKLRHEVKTNRHGMTLQGPHRILEDEWMISIGREEVSEGFSWVNRRPVQEILFRSQWLEIHRHLEHLGTLTLSWKLTSACKDESNMISKALGSQVAFSGKLRINHRISVCILIDGNRTES